MQMSKVKNKWLRFRNKYRHHLFVTSMALPVVLSAIFFYIDPGPWVSNVFGVYVIANILVIPNLRAFLFDEAFSTSSTHWEADEENYQSNPRYIFGLYKILTHLTLQGAMIYFLLNHLDYG